MLDNRAGLGVADVIWVPQHDRLRGANVITTLTAPHSFTAARLAALRATVPAAIAALPRPRIAVILGGKNKVYEFRDEDDARFAGALKSLGALGASFMITPSRRTHARLLEVTDEATRAFPRILWDGEGANPYGDFLAHADALIVTADSVNMTGEACGNRAPGAACSRRRPAPTSSAASTRRCKPTAPRGRCPSASRRCPTGATSRCIRPTRSRARSSAAGSAARMRSRDAESQRAQSDDVLCAGGTLSVPQLSAPARAWRIAEMALLYGAAPFAVDRAVHGDGIPVFIALLPVLAIILMFLSSTARSRCAASCRAASRWRSSAPSSPCSPSAAASSPPTSPSITRRGSSSFRANGPRPTCASCCSIR